MNDLMPFTAYDWQRYINATESAYWRLKPYRTRWQQFCRWLYKRTSWSWRFKLWLLRQAKA